MDIAISSLLFRLVIKGLKYQDKCLTGLSMRAMSWLGRSKHPIHPKHLYDSNRNVFLESLMTPHSHFLDIGSGSGSECLNALKAGADIVYGVEYNKDSIALSHDRLSDYEGKYQIFDLDLEKAQIPLESQSIDLISFSNVLEHLHNRQAILTELCRLLKQNGKMYISIPNTNTPWKKFQRQHGVDSRDDDDHKIEYSVDSLKQEMDQAGLKIVTDLHPIVPSMPINGVIALTAIISPKIYCRLQKWKHSYTNKHPNHSIGWYFLVEPQ